MKEEEQTDETFLFSRDGASPDENEGEHRDEFSEDVHGADITKYPPGNDVEVEVTWKVVE